ncbi:vanadium-dependent haloperoxidase [Mucilaginibacter lacusdianchii]|uniref:vanadium-dependent haloperoxidase n=1 Tax=Mucilaginibacter lacusdianchii TaxID=2684211 RepID=UPI00131E92AF|nr:vanadium-dependent haloperoxidase [Mucilaginibacter sp. JXJ CY 39]
MKRLIIVILFCIVALKPGFALSAKNVPEHLSMQRPLNAISLVMMHDVISPPVAGRYYAYVMLGAYQIVSAYNTSMPDASQFTKSYRTTLEKNKYKGADYQIAAAYCVLEAGKQLLPSGYTLQEEQDKYIALLKKQKVKDEVIQQSISEATDMANQVVAYAKTDNYFGLSTKLRYTPIKGEAYWYPTPPTYMEAVEPNWATLKPLMIDSGGQFKPKPAVPFSKETGSEFYKIANEVYTTAKTATPEQINIANFWECNPFTVVTSGHMMIGFKKLSPGGHWMNIALIAAAKANLNFDQTIELLTLEAATLMDSFICCWKEKYTSNRIRPETYINRYIDLKWTPLLQTPPFPDYTSGHSIISSASAEVLTYLLGDNFSYTDDSEVPYDVQPRNFTSFRQAAQEAGISRLYGGIHFRDSIENGYEQGERIAQYILAAITKAGIKPLKNTQY